MRRYIVLMDTSMPLSSPRKQWVVKATASCPMCLILTRAVLVGCVFRAVLEGRRGNPSNSVLGTHSETHQVVLGSSSKIIMKALKSFSCQVKLKSPEVAKGQISLFCVTEFLRDAQACELNKKKKKQRPGKKSSASPFPALSVVWHQIALVLVVK